MSQTVGFQYKSRIPTLSDDATIVEALKVYHYGVDDYSTQPIPNDSIEGNFRTLNTAVTALQSAVSGLGTTYVEQVSLTASPNVITGQSTTAVPLTIRSISSQTSPLQQWQNSSSVNVGSIAVSGNMNLAGYLTLGSTTQATTIGLNVITGNAAHNGIVVRAQSSQSANIQEWQNSSGTAIAWVDKDGKIFSESSQVLTVSSNIPQSSIISLVNDLSSKAPLNISATSLTDSYTLVLTDTSKLVEINKSTANNLTVPTNSSVPFPIGSSIVVLQSGSGQTTIVPSTGVTINATPGLKLRTQWSLATLIKRGTDVWVLAGDVVA